MAVPLDPQAQSEKQYPFQGAVLPAVQIEVELGLQPRLRQPCPRRLRLEADANASGVEKAARLSYEDWISNRSNRKYQMRGNIAVEQALIFVSETSIIPLAVSMLEAMHSAALAFATDCRRVAPTKWCSTQLIVMRSNLILIHS
jgi:hypothetical protein